MLKVKGWKIVQRDYLRSGLKGTLRKRNELPLKIPFILILFSLEALYEGSKLEEKDIHE